MSFLRIRTIKGKQYLYRQTSVRKGKKVRTISEYLGALGWIAVAAASPGYIGSRGHQSTDKRGLRDQDQADRERFKKEMENPRERFQREAAKAALARSGSKGPTDEKFAKDCADMRQFSDSLKNPNGTKS
jgi:hypothetical protein